MNNPPSSNNSVNPSVSVQERAIIIENIKKFLIEHLPADQVTSPQKAHELAVRFENHVALSTSTKEQYQGMIAEKLRMIKAKSFEPSPVLSNTSNTSNTTNTANTTNIANPANSTNPTTATPMNLSPQEISQISTRLQQIRPQIPQIDKLLLLHSKLTGAAPLNTADMTKKLTDCRNILVNQIEIAAAGRKNFVMNLSQLNLLIEQVQRLFNSLVSKMKESAGVSPALSTASKVSSVNTGTGTVPSQAQSIAHTSSTKSSNSSMHNSSTSSIISSHSSSKHQQLQQQKSSVQNSPDFDKVLLQRLSLPPDITKTHDHYLKRLINVNSSRKSALKTVDQKHLKQRNRLLSLELKALNQKYIVQDCGLGNLNVLISTERHRFVFQISQKYPYDQLIYRIEEKSTRSGAKLLPSHLEPKTFPLTITSILRNFKE